MPPFESFDRHGLQLDIVPARDLLDAIGREACEFGDGPTKGLDPTNALVFHCVLLYQVADLPVCAAADHDQDTAGLEVSYRII